MAVRESKFSFDGSEGRRKILMALREALKFSMALKELALIYLFDSRLINGLLLYYYYSPALDKNIYYIFYDEPARARKRTEPS
jgi:hypothetical protein